MPLYHTGKFAATSQQFGGSALLGNRTVFEHHYLVGIGDGSHTVGDDKHSLVAYQFRDACLYLGLVLHVEAGGGFVEQHYWGVFEQSTGDGDALTFATRECGAVLADERVVALGHTADELVATSQLCHAAYLLIGGVGLADTDIVGNARVEQQHVLEDHRIVFEQCLGLSSRCLARRG